jgi:colicin import membrane protein
VKKSILPYYLIVLFSLFINQINAQSKKDLEIKIGNLEKLQSETMTEVHSLKHEIALLKTELGKVKEENSLLTQKLATIESNANAIQPQNLIGETKESTQASGQCKAVTSKGTQCSRKADAGSDYCWQHKSTYEPNSTPSKAVSSPAKSSGTTGSGRTIYTGPRGGKYYINSNGKKTYIK